MTECCYFFLTATKIKQLYNKFVDNYPRASEFVSDCFKTHRICNKAVDTYLFAIQFVPQCYKTQKICAKAVNNCHFEFYPVPYRYNTQEMSRKAIDNFVPALKFFPHWFVPNKIIKKVDNTLSLMMIYSILMKILIMPIF